MFFCNVLLLLWEQISPPTSIHTAHQFLELTDDFARDRNFFDDDPLVTLEKLNITAADFTSKDNYEPEKSKDWNQYPIVGLLLDIWNNVGNHVEDFVEHTYQNDQEVRDDHALQQWIERCWYKVRREPAGHSGESGGDTR